MSAAPPTQEDFRLGLFTNSEVRRGTSSGTGSGIAIVADCGVLHWKTETNSGGASYLIACLTWVMECKGRRPAGRGRSRPRASVSREVGVLTACPGVGAPPAHLLAPQYRTHLAAVNVDAALPGSCGEGVQRPDRGRAFLGGGPRLPPGGRVQPPGRIGAGQRDDPTALLLADAGLASASGAIAQPRPGRRR